MRQEDVLVLPLDLLQFDTHQGAVDSVLKHFGQVGFPDNAGQRQSFSAHPYFLHP